MNEAALAGPVGLRELARGCVASVRKKVRRRLSVLHNPLWSWTASQAARLRRLTLPQMTVIGVTGSCGKSTTTCLTGAILSARFLCHEKAGPNTHYTAARTMLSLARSTQFCVHEVAAYEPGSVARTAKILMPQIGVVTMIGTDHYSTFRGLEGVAQEKATLIEALPSTGTAILNIDDPHVHAMAVRTRAKILTFGRSTAADIRAANISSAWPDRLRLTVIHGDQVAQISTRLVGEHWVPSVLAAIACGIACGVGLEDCAGEIAAFEPAFGCCSVHGVTGGPVFIFDHKASYWTIASSLDFLRKARTPRKTIVFGTLSDYPGAVSPRYRRAARDALSVADRVVFVGLHSSHIERMRVGDLRDRLFCFPTVHQANNYLAKDSLPAELIVMKGSIKADHLERIFLSQIDHVVCWRERCGRAKPCPDCSAYGKPWPPSVAETDREISGWSTTDPRPIMFGRPS